MRDKKGFALTLDAILSLVFVLAIFMALSAYRYTDISETTRAAFINMHFVSEDVLEVLNKQGVLDIVGEEWTSGNQTLAINISTEYLDDLIPPQME